MFNAKRYMHMNDAYFTPDQVMFTYDAKKIFDRMVHELHYLNIENPYHFAWTGYLSTDFFKVRAILFL